MFKIWINLIITLFFPFIQKNMFMANNQWFNPIDKAYIDGPCGSKTLAGVMLARSGRKSHVTHFYK